MTAHSPKLNKNDRLTSHDRGDEFRRVARCRLATLPDTVGGGYADMATNFTVIQFQRQHFGNEPGSFNDIEPAVPFVGPAKDFVFDCPNVDPNDTALLLFQSRDVSHATNVFQVNGIQVFGGLPVSPSRDTWNGNVLLVERHHGLRATGNVLHVESRNASGGAATSMTS